MKIRHIDRQHCDFVKSCILNYPIYLLWISQLFFRAWVAFHFLHSSFPDFLLYTSPILRIHHFYTCTKYVYFCCLSQVITYMSVSPWVCNNLAKSYSIHFCIFHNTQYSDLQLINFMAISFVIFLGIIHD